MEDVIISQPRTLDTILLDGKHSLTAYITIGLIKSGHFRIYLDFENFDKESLDYLFELYLPVRALPITSKIIAKDSYNISHIIIEKFRIVEKVSITWECIADDPNCSLL
jgi:hypothetical protein